jgi:hypothetical protein
MIETYANLIQLTEETSRIALKSLDVQLKKQNINDTNSKECLILYKIENTKMNNVSFKYIKESIFVGTNPSYIIKKMTDNGYICQIINNHDSRQLNLGLTPKGKELYKKISEFMEKDLQLLNENDLSTELLNNYHNFSKKFKNILFNKISNEMIVV